MAGILGALPVDEHVDLDEVLRRVMDAVVAHLDADRGTLYLVDHARHEVISRAAHLPEISEIRLGWGEGVAGWVAERGRCVRVPESEADDRFAPRIDALTGYHTRSMMAAPVLDGDCVIGVLQVLNKREGHFDAKDERRIQALAAEVTKVLAQTSLHSQLRPDAERPLHFHFNHIVGESAAMQDVFRRTARAAATSATVIVRGESGSGKEALARAVHVNSPRAEGPFVKVDCAALPAQLIENELFGHEKGAFTGADARREGKVLAADGGTLFLDEVGELPLAVQGKLLRLLQERAYLRVGGNRPVKVDVRFVCATHRDLEALVRSGEFRQDLYYRLRVVQIDVPPLRARGAADLDRLTTHFLHTCARRHGRSVPRLTEAAQQRLHAHSWPGNVRELEHAIESAVVLADELIDADALPLGSAAAPALDPSLFVSEIKSLREVERDYVRHVLGQCGGNKSEAARRLCIGRNTLQRKL